MKISILNDDDKTLSLEIEGEGHTLCNLLRNKLWELDVTSCGYNLKHPIISSPVLNIKVSKGKPRKVLSLCVDELRKDVKTLRTEFKKLK